MDGSKPRAGKYCEQEYEQEYLLMVSRDISWVWAGIFVDGEQGYLLMVSRDIYWWWAGIFIDGEQGYLLMVSRNIQLTGPSNDTWQVLSFYSWANLSFNPHTCLCNRQETARKLHPNHLTTNDI